VLDVLVDGEEHTFIRAAMWLGRLHAESHRLSSRLGLSRRGLRTIRVFAVVELKDSQPSRREYL
jgi:hypothetical protein